MDKFVSFCMMAVFSERVTSFILFFLRGGYDHPDASKQRHVIDDNDIAQRFRLNITDDGDGELVIWNTVDSR